MLCITPTRIVKKFLAALVSLIGIFPWVASAHENYVLTPDQIAYGIKDQSYNVIDSLRTPGNLTIALTVSVGGIIFFLLYFFFDRSQAGKYLNQKLLSLELFGQAVLRIALGFSFIASAYTSSYLGPEISVFSLPFGGIIHYTLYVLGFFLVVGWYTEIVGVVGLATLLLAAFIYKDYMLTYFNYAGEFLALIFFGSRAFSIDAKRRMKRDISERYQNFEKAIIRITYGISILYPAISIKLLHPWIIIEIVNKYHLNSIHWLFPSDPLLIALGTGLAQVVVGTCLVLGIFTRFNTLITFVLMVMSVLFFKEAVWPHYILLALALYLMINNGGEFGLDRYIRKWRIGQS
jgi:uncharacterized membrane protein YphA (DoxX/SURF4 family)